MQWDDAKFATMDFETSGVLPEYALQPWRVPHDQMWATSFVGLEKDGDGFRTTGGLMVGMSHEQIAGMLADFLEEKRDKGQTIIGWNTVFDIMCFFAYGLDDLVYENKWLDGMLLWKHWFIEPEYEMDRSKKKSYGLKASVEEFMPSQAGYEDDVDFHSTDPEELHKLHIYNERDNAFTWVQAKRFYRRLQKTPQRLKAALIEAECLPQVAETNYRGMLLDTLEAHSLRDYLTKVANKRLAELAPHGVTEKIVRSPMQLATLMYDEWKLPVLKQTKGKKTGKVSRATDKEVLHELAFKDPRAKKLKEYREALNNRTKFADTPLKAWEYSPDDHIYPQANIFGTYSGRFTYSSSQGKNKDKRQIGFALHQEKRDAMYRAIITAPKGYTVVEFDAAGQEFRWMAVASGDETMLALCMPGEDPHSFMGAQIGQREYHDVMAGVKAKEKWALNLRQGGKVGNLSLQYRTSARKLRVVARVQYNMPMELPEAQFIHKTYRQSYKGVPIYWGRQIEETRRTGYVETLAGRRVQVTGDWEGTWGWSMGSTAINYRIQGTGADQKYLAMAVLKDYMRDLGAYFAWDLHDGLYWYVPDAHVERVAVEGRQMLADLPYKDAWGFTPPIPLPWDCKTGKSWGSLREWKD